MGAVNHSALGEKEKSQKRKERQGTRDNFYHDELYIPKI